MLASLSMSSEYHKARASRQGWPTHKAALAETNSRHTPPSRTSTCNGLGPKSKHLDWSLELPYTRYVSVSTRQRFFESAKHTSQKGLDRSRPPLAREETRSPFLRPYSSPAADQGGKKKEFTAVWECTRREAYGSCKASATCTHGRETLVAPFK